MILRDELRARPLSVQPAPQGSDIDGVHTGSGGGLEPFIAVFVDQTVAGVDVEQRGCSEDDVGRGLATVDILPSHFDVEISAKVEGVAGGEHCRGATAGGEGCATMPALSAEDMSDVGYFADVGEERDVHLVPTSGDQVNVDGEAATYGQGLDHVVRGQPCTRAEPVRADLELHRIESSSNSAVIHCLAVGEGPIPVEQERTVLIARFEVGECCGFANLHRSILHPVDRGREPARSLGQYGAPA